MESTTVMKPLSSSAFHLPMDGIRLHPRLTDADGENGGKLSGIGPAPLYRVQVHQKSISSPPESRSDVETTVSSEMSSPSVECVSSDSM